MAAGRIVLLSVVMATAAIAASALAAGPLLPGDRAAGAGDDGVRNNARPLPFFYDLYTFRGTNGRTAVVASFAVEAGSLETESHFSRVQYRFSVTLVLADTARQTVTNTHDTVFVDLPRRLPDEYLLYTHTEVAARPSTTTQQRVIMIDATTPGIGQLYTDHFLIPDYSGTHLMLSDIALGQPDALSGWTRGRTTLALLPTSQFPSSAFDVYYEIYNLPAGTPYMTEIAVERIPEAGAPLPEDERPLRLRFAGESSAGRDAAVHELRRVETSLERGRYRSTVTITNGRKGETATRARTFEVKGWERGTMMVPAVPLRIGAKR
jgi:hypothetical protein